MVSEVLCGFVTTACQNETRNTYRSLKYGRKVIHWKHINFEQFAVFFKLHYMIKPYV